MKRFEIAEQILANIIDNDVEFSEALKEVFLKNVDLRPLRPDVSGLVGCELRHHLLFEYLLDGIEEGKLDPSDKRKASLVLANNYFFRRIDDAEARNWLKELLGEDKFALIAPLFKEGDDRKNIIPEHLDKTSSKYLSLRFNTPEWVLKIWRHFGHGTTYKIMVKNCKQMITPVRVRTSLISTDELLNSNQYFVKSPVDSILFYGGKEPLRKMQEFKDHKLFVEKCATKYIIDKFNVSDPSEILCYCGNKDDSIMMELIERFGHNVGMNFGVSNADEHLNIKKTIKNECYSNINYFVAAPDSLEAYVSKPQDLVIAVPDSTNFDLIREKPDYLLHFKKDNMDALFAQEKAVLENCAKYVDEGGQLVYVIYTISMKEGEKTINAFLADHPEFQIVKMEQHFPFEPMDTSIFFAILEKNTPLVKTGVPLNDLQTTSNGVTANLSASQQQGE